MNTAAALFLVLFSTTSFAFKSNVPGKILRPQFVSVPACEARPEFLSEIRTDFTSNLQQLPPTVLVARDAEYYAEGKREEKDIRVHAYESFLKKNSSQVLCGNSPEEAQRFSLVAPTLIDTHKKPRVGQSLWQFQAMTEAGKFSFWNLKSPSLSTTANIESFLKESGASYKMYQRSHDEFELLVIKKEGGVTQYLSIRYDAIKKR